MAQAIGVRARPRPASDAQGSIERVSDAHEIDGDPGGDGHGRSPTAAFIRKAGSPNGLEDDRGEPAEEDVGREARRVGGAHERADRLELAGVPERDTGHAGRATAAANATTATAMAGSQVRGVSSGDPVLRSGRPSTLVQEPFPVTGPASGGTERGTRAPSGSTGMQGPSARS